MGELRKALCSEAEVADVPAMVCGEPLVALAEAVRTGVLSPAGRLIHATWLDGRTLREYAAEPGVSAERSYKQRRMAETALARAIDEGHIWTNSDDRVPVQGDETPHRSIPASIRRGTVPRR